MPSPTAAALPPLDPPAVVAGFHGLPVGPNAIESVTPFHAYSGVVVLPRITAPVSRSRRRARSAILRSVMSDVSVISNISLEGSHPASVMRFRSAVIVSASHRL